MKTDVNPILALCAEVESDIQRAYTEGVTVEEAEKLAAKFLHAQIEIGNELRDADLDARMKKTGVKSVRAAVYLEAAQKGEKKPSDTFLEALVNNSPLVAAEQGALDKAEVAKDTLQNYLNVAKEAHIYFRGISKGRFD